MNRTALIILTTCLFAASCGGSEESESVDSTTSSSVTTTSTTDEETIDDSIGFSEETSSTNETPTESTATKSTTSSVVAQSTAVGSGSEALVLAIANDFISATGGEYLQSQGICIGQNIVDSIGEARLTELGVTAQDASKSSTADYTDAEQVKVAESTVSCIDASGLLKTFYTNFGMPKESAECIVDKLSPGTVSAGVVAIMSNSKDTDPKFEAELLKATEECTG